MDPYFWSETPHFGEYFFCKGRRRLCIVFREGKGSAVFVDGKGRGTRVTALKQDKQFLAFAVKGNYMNVSYFPAQPPVQHGDVGHRGELQ